MGLNFVTILLLTFFCKKKQFWGPSRVVPLWALFSSFPPLFFYRFFFFFSFSFIFFHLLSFLLLFIFSFFSFFCSFLHYLDFSMFFIFSFSFFSDFKHVLLLALVSEFNCFLRSRCSMEMWCLEDIGRDSWDWAGPPAWGRARFNSPEWGGGSSPVKTEPPQIVLLLLLFGTRALMCDVYGHNDMAMQ